MCALALDCTVLSFILIYKNIVGVPQRYSLSLSVITQIIVFGTGETTFPIFEFLSNLRRRLGCREFLGR